MVRLQKFALYPEARRNTPVTQDNLRPDVEALRVAIEEETGHGVSLWPSPALTAAKVTPAKASAQRHIIEYGAQLSRDNASAMIAHELIHLRRWWSVPQEQRMRPYPADTSGTGEYAQAFEAILEEAYNHALDPLVERQVRDALPELLDIQKTNQRESLAGARNVLSPKYGFNFPGLLRRASIASWTAFSRQIADAVDIHNSEIPWPDDVVPEEAVDLAQQLTHAAVSFTDSPGEDIERVNAWIRTLDMGKYLSWKPIALP
jgi:hypothetical protein